MKMEVKLVNKILRTLKKHWTRVWLIFVLLLSGGIYITYAAYTEVSSVKRVVSTQASPGQMFSSNCMKTEILNVRVSSGEYSVTVCNYDQDKPKTFNPSIVNYTVTAKLMVRTGDTYTPFDEYLNTLAEPDKTTYNKKAAKFKICKSEDDDTGLISPVSDLSFNSENNFTCTFSSESLAAQKAAVDKYNIKIDLVNNTDVDITNVYVEVTADPTSDTLATLSSRLYYAEIKTSEANWEGYIVESDCSVADYDFYNYVITGNGKGTVDIKWDPDKFELNPFFLSDSSNSFSVEPDITVSGKTWKKITLYVDSEKKNRYEIQLYKTSTSAEGGERYTGDNAASKYIQCSFTPKASTP